MYAREGYIFFAELERGESVPGTFGFEVAMMWIDVGNLFFVFRWVGLMMMMNGFCR